MPAIPFITAASGIYGVVSGADQARKAANQANDAAKNAGINIPQVAGMAHDQAIQNAHDSAALEAQMNPLAPQLRTQSLQAVIDALSGGKYDDAIASSLYDQFKSPPAFSDYGQSQLSLAAQAEAMRQLQLGGKLDTETANEVIRSSAAKAGGFGNTLGLGHDLSARDLGLKSLALQQFRLGQAQQYGGAQDSFLAQHSAAVNNYQLQQLMQRMNLGFGITGLSSSAMQAALAAGQFGQSIAQPVTGLDPTAIANLAVGNSNAKTAAATNAAAIAAQGGTGMAGLGGQLLGLGMTGFGKPKTSVSPLPAAPTFNAVTMPKANLGLSGAYNPFG